MQEKKKSEKRFMGVKSTEQEENKLFRGQLPLLERQCQAAAGYWDGIVQLY